MFCQKAKGIERQPVSFNSLSCWLVVIGSVCVRHLPGCESQMRIENGQAIYVADDASVS